MARQALVSAKRVRFLVPKLIVEFVLLGNFSKKTLRLAEIATMLSALTALPHQLPALSAPTATVSFQALANAAVVMLEQTIRFVKHVFQDNTLMEERAWVVRTPNAKTAHSQQLEFVRNVTRHSRRQDQIAPARATSS